MIKALVIDDEAHCVESLCMDLERYCPEISIEAALNSSKDGLNAIKKIHPDLVFLDIEMPWMNGFELLDFLHPVQFEVIFTTAYDSYAIDAFKVSAVDYLMKPIDKDDLIAAVKKVKQKLLSQQPDQNGIHELLNNYFSSQNVKKIVFSEKDKQQFVDPQDIIYVKAESNYSKIYLDGQNPLTLSITLKNVESKLTGNTFLRVHHSYLVNMDKVTQYVKSEGGYLVLMDNTKIPISRSRKSELKKILEKDFRS